MSNRTAEQDVARGKFENFFTRITHGSSESFDPAVRRGKLSISALLQQLNSPPRSFLIITARLSDSICVLSLFLAIFSQNFLIPAHFVKPSAIFLLRAHIYFAHFLSSSPPASSSPSSFHLSSSELLASWWDASLPPRP